MTPEERIQQKDWQERNAQFLHDVVGGVSDIGKRVGTAVLDFPGQLRKGLGPSIQRGAGAAREVEMGADPTGKAIMQGAPAGFMAQLLRDPKAYQRMADWYSSERDRKGEVTLPDIAGAVVGETPGEMAFNLALGPTGKAVKLAAGAAVPIAYSGETEGGIPAGSKISQSARQTLANMVNREGRPGDLSRVMLDLQEQNLPQEVLRKADAIGRESDAFARARPYLNPVQLGKATRSSQTGRLYGENYDLQPPVDEIVSIMRAGEPRRGWYAGSREATGAMFPGAEATRAAYGKSALSPQTSVESNLENFTSTYFPWKAAGEPKDAKSINRILAENVQQKPIIAQGDEVQRSMSQVESLARHLNVPPRFLATATPDELRLLLQMYAGSTPSAGAQVRAASVLPAWQGNFQRALRGETLLSGPKVHNFAGNLDPRNPFAPLHSTADTWDATMMGLPQKKYAGGGADPKFGDPGYSPGYSMSSARKGEAADRLGWTHEEGQETSWNWTKPIGEGLGRHGVILPDNVIQNVPDFQTLLRSPEIWAKLPDAQKRALDQLQPKSFPSAPRHQFSPAEMEQLRRAEQRILATRARYKGAGEE
jgi:hypothetical protein